MFEVHCASCHASPTDDRPPTKEALRQLTPEAVLAALTTGAMVVQASELRDGQKRLLAEHVAGAPLGSARAGDATDDRPPTKEALRQLTPEAVLAALTTGAMVVQASELRDGQKRLLAEHVAGAPLGSARAGDASAMPNRCAAESFEDPFSRPMWNGWGVDATNGRFQSAEAAGLSA